jgi:formate hydrogenlyase subunit 4
MNPLALALHLAILCGLGPILVGLIVKTKARMGGRRGPPLLQPWYDIAKLLRKGAVYSRTTTIVFRAGPIVALAATAAAGLLAPLGRGGPPVSFYCDIVLFAYLLGLARFATVAAALDTGSAFEGMGASREVAFSALSEPTLFLALIVLGREAGAPSLGAIAAHLTRATWGDLGPALFLAAVALLIVVLAENARVPVDDPATHLELTMIHEVMVLDHGGPDFAFISYGAAMKLVVTGSLLVTPFLPESRGPLFDAGAFVAAMLALAVLIGMVESLMARLRMPRVPLLLGGALVAATLAVVAGGPR